MFRNEELFKINRKKTLIPIVFFCKTNSMFEIILCQCFPERVAIVYLGDTFLAIAQNWPLAELSLAWVKIKLMTSEQIIKKGKLETQGDKRNNGNHLPKIVCVHMILLNISWGKKNVAQVCSLCSVQAVGSSFFRSLLPSSAQGQAQVGLSWLHSEQTNPSTHTHPPRKVFSQLQLTKYV